MTVGSELAFKICPNCGCNWETRREFLADPKIRLIGYQAHFKKLEAGIFLFNHACRGTLALRCGDFRDLYHGEIFAERATGGAQCPGHCLHKDNLLRCPGQCECSYVREIIQIIRDWPKS